MDTQLQQYTILDLMIQPAFCVKNGIIQKVNPAAQALLISAGTEISSMLLTGTEEYAAFESGCLYLQLDVGGTAYGASITRTEEMDIFLLEPEEGDKALQALNQASRVLRQPLGSLIAITENLLPHALPERDEKSDALIAQLSRNLYRIERILGNMADAGQTQALYHPEPKNVSAVFDDIFEKAGALLQEAGISLTYRGLKTDVYGTVDPSLLERAVLNLLSNAAKFTGSKATIQATLSQRGKMLSLRITDQGSGLPEGILGSLFNRYLRQPGLEDSRFGLGLGMVLVRSAALCHGGTVLIHQPEESGTQVTMTLRLDQKAPAMLHSPISSLTGGRDPALIEFSELLPARVYQKEL